MVKSQGTFSFKESNWDMKTNQLLSARSVTVTLLLILNSSDGWKTIQGKKKRQKEREKERKAFTGKL